MSKIRPLFSLVSPFYLSYLELEWVLLCCFHTSYYLSTKHHSNRWSVSMTTEHDAMLTWSSFEEELEEVKHGHRESMLVISFADSLNAKEGVSYTEANKYE